jgi:ABC-type uncharacterized transport system substrate-binding protein
VNRRELVTLLGGAAAAWPVAARAQQRAVPVIGWLGRRSPESDAVVVLPAFRRGLETQGYVEGRNVAIEYRWAEGQMDQRVALANDLIHRGVNVIVAPGTPAEAMQAAQAARSNTPIVFVSGSDPVAMGLVASLNRPGGNLTGISTLLRQIAPKRLGLLNDLLPRSTLIAVLENPASAPLLESPDLLTAARSLGKDVSVLNASNESEIDTAFAKLAQMRADALLLATHTLFLTRADQIIAQAARLAMPTLYYRREFAVAGGLMSYGPDSEEVNRVLGEYTGRVLKGEKPADLPIVQPTKFEMVVNLKTAKALGLTVPPTLLALADEVIE